MMKKILTTITMVLAVSVSIEAYSFCGGAVVSNNDCSGNALQYSTSCCEPGYRIQGVVYNDLKGQDNVDAVGAVCRHVKKGNVKIASDFYNRGNRGRKQPIQFVCDRTEVFAGIACKDLPKKDSLDGCTAICQKPGGAERVIYNPDLASNPRAYIRHTVQLPHRVAGIGYKEEKLRSDRADCANISSRFEPIVKP